MALRTLMQTVLASVATDLEQIAIEVGRGGAQEADAAGRIRGRLLTIVSTVQILEASVGEAAQLRRPA
jgi:hypothetical protein